MKKDKTRLTLIAIVTIAVLATVALYSFTVISKEKVNTGSIISMAIPLVIIVFMAFFILRRYRDVKQGMPLEDERSRKVVTLAAAKSFYVSLYWLLAISWFEEFFANKLFGVEHLDVGQAVGGGIIGMAILFFAFWIYYNKKGKID